MTSGVLICSMINCATRSPSLTVPVLVRFYELTNEMLYFTFEVRVGVVEQENHDNTTVVRVNNASTGVNHKLRRLRQLEYETWRGD